jgi:hypothetical protein
VDVHAPASTSALTKATADRRETPTRSANSAWDSGHDHWVLSVANDGPAVKRGTMLGCGRG